MVRKIVRPETGGHRGALQRRAPSGLLPIALLLVAGACDASSPSIGPTVTPAATPTARPAPSPAETKKPFLWALVADGSMTGGFVEVTGASAGSVCSVKAFLKSGRKISSPALKPRTVTDPSRRVSWSDSDKDGPLLILPSPAPSPGENAYWRVTCVNNAFDPPSGTTTFAFKTP